MNALMLLAGFLALAYPPQSETCAPVDPASMIWTRQGYSIAMGDGHLTVLHEDVRYGDGPLRVCIPAHHGMARLYLPKQQWLVQAHGAYAWIADHGYKGTDGLHCCGWNDCMQVPAESVRPTPDGSGYYTQKGIISNKGVYHSRDGKAWICRFQSGPPKCLFVPGGG